MCSCSSNFNGLDDVEEVKFLDFDGEDVSVDGDFDDFLGFGKKAKAKRQEKKTAKLEAKATNYDSFDDCMKNKPLLRKKSVWETACKTQFGNSSALLKDDSFKEAVSNGNITNDEAQKLTQDVKSGKTTLEQAKAIVNATLKKAGEIEKAKANVENEPQKAGFLNTKTLIVVGSVLAIGIVGYLAFKPKN